MTVSDFHKEYLVQNRQNTTVWRLLLQFSITEDGLTLDASDDISVGEVKAETDSNVRRFNELLSSYKTDANLDTDTAGTEYTRDFKSILRKLLVA
jgi:hypothetical protein